MAVKARIFSKCTEGDPTDVVFAYPLREGDEFALRSESRGPLVCKVTSVTHYPVNDGSEEEPSVAYFVTMTPADEMRTWWWAIKHTVGGIIDKRLTPK